ncbi:retention module-containing protein, partial [Pseudomonas sp. TNT2022 ID681]
MSSVVAIVKSIVGQVIAVSPEGIQRVLIEGDRLFLGDQVLTGLSGAVTLELADGRTLDLGRDTQWSADTPDSSTDLSEATAQAAPSVEELQQAIVAGADPTTDLEATAAGPTSAGGGAAGGSHSFVMLDETAGVVDPTIGFPTVGLGFNAALDTEEVGGLLNNGATNNNGTTELRAAGLTLSATPTLTEAGGALTYTATLTQAPLTDLTVTLSNGQTLVIPAGQTSGSLTVTIPPGDTVYLDAHEITTSITGTTGGAGLLVTPDTKPAVTQITDTQDTTTVNLSATGSVTEGGVIVYTATLTNPAQTPVTVTLSNGSVITIAAGQNSGTVNVQTPPNDVYNNGGTISTSITGATGGNFENLVPGATPAVTTVNDSLDTTTVSLTATPTVGENGVITYTASTTSPVTGSPVVVTLSNGQTISIPVGGSSGTVNVTAPNDVYNGAEPISTTIAGTTGGNFENLVPNGTPAVTAVTDSVDTTAVTLTATPTVGENGVITYTASTSSPVTGTPVVVTLSNGQTITIAVGQASGTVDVTAPNDVYKGAEPISTTITGATGGDFEKLQPNGQPAVTVVNDTVDTTTVSLTASPTVAENGVITYTATVTSPVTGSPVLVTLSNGQTISIAVGETSGTLNVTAPNDVYNGAEPISTVITGTTGGNFENLVPNTAAAVTTVSDSPDVTGLSLTATGNVAEGGQIVYTATLTNPAGTALTVTLSNGQTITIAAGQTSNSISVNAPSDSVYLRSARRPLR